MGGVGGGSRALLASLLCRVTAQRVPLLDTKRASTTPLQRLVRSLTTSETVNEKISPAAAAAAASTEGNGAGTSDQTEPSKRPVRGGPVSWLSLVLLMITGGGLVFYYDKEKKRHIEEFHPNLIGLTGTPEEIRQVARAYRVYFMKTEEEGSDYLVDHSIVMYLMNPKMEFVKFYGKNYDVDTLAEGIIKEIKGHN